MAKKDHDFPDGQDSDLDITMQNCLLNLEDFALTALNKRDHSCFDIVAITRIEPEPGYTKHSYHCVIDTQAVRIDFESQQRRNQRH